MSEFLLTIPETTQESIGADAIAGTLAGVKVELLKTAIAISPETTLAELQAAKADYAGYAAGVVTWSAVTRADDAAIEYLGSCPEFRPTGGTPSNMVQGAYVENTAGDKWIAACSFDPPGLGMSGAMDSIRLTLRYRPAGGSKVDIIS